MDTLVHDTPLQPIDLARAAAVLPDTWRSTKLGAANGAAVKVLRMDARDYADEIHDYDEALLVLDGRMNLRVRGEVVAVRTGEVVVVPAGTLHGVAPGSHGTLFVVGR
jgi:mannose-6-phosphate isomerase-like protein (cupin superfamily)